MSEVNVLWSSAWFKLQKSLAKGSLDASSSMAGLICDPQVPNAALTTGSWLVRARRGIAQEPSPSH